jgi:hypothetical protein
MSRYLKDAQAELDYKFDWAPLTNGSSDESDWLSPGETIASYIITNESVSPEELVVYKSSKTDTNTSVTVWLSGGIAGKSYQVACRITTNNSPARTDERTITIICQER